MVSPGAPGSPSHPTGVQKEEINSQSFTELSVLVEVTWEMYVVYLFVLKKKSSRM